jgi:hypothetical protein
VPSDTVAESLRRGGDHHSAGTSGSSQPIRQRIVDEYLQDDAS